MSALERHLAGTHHDDLPFHPLCPTCRATRLSGSLPSGPVMGPRARANVLAALLAGGALAPAAAGPAVAAAQSPTSNAIGGDEDPVDDESDDPVGDAQANLPPTPDPDAPPEDDA